MRLTKLGLAEPAPEKPSMKLMFDAAETAQQCVTELLLVV